MNENDNDTTEAEYENKRGECERRRELIFNPHLTVDVPRSTFAKAMEWVEIEGEPEELAPYSPGSEYNEFEEALFEFYEPTFTWRVADDEE